MPSDFSSSKFQKLADPSVVPASAERTIHEDEISPLDLLLILAKQKHIILSVTAIFAILAVIVSLLLPVRYIARVTLLTPQQNSSMSSMLASQLGSMGGMAALAGGSLGIKNPNDMYVALLKSRTVEDAMVQRYGLMQEYHARFTSDARKAFESNVNIDGSGKDGLIHISVQDRDPRRAADLANGYVDLFRLQSQHLAITEASQRRLFFEQQLGQAKNNLTNAEEAMKQTEQKTGVIQLDSQAKALIESAASLQAAVAAKEVQIQGMRTYATGENAQLVQAQQELGSLRAQLAQLGGSTDDDSEGLIVPKGRVPEAGLEYVRRLRDIKYNEAIFDILMRQFEVAKLDEAKQGALIQVVDPAIPPDRRSSPRRGLIVIGTTMVGFFFGLFAVLLRAGFRQLKSAPKTNKKMTTLKKELFFKRSAE